MNHLRSLKMAVEAPVPGWLERPNATDRVLGDPVGRCRSHNCSGVVLSGHISASDCGVVKIGVHRQFLESIVLLNDVVVGKVHRNRAQDHRLVDRLARTNGLGNVEIVMLHRCGGPTGS